MNGTSRVHSPEERAQMRRLSEKSIRCWQWRFIACTSILRTALTQVLPLAGSAGWWMTPVCLLPGAIVYGVFCRLLRRGYLWRRGVWWLATGALLADALCSMTAMITLFTQGVGAQGTQFTLAAVAGGMLLLCLNREGLARGIYFLRRPLILILAGVAAGYVMHARADHLFPLMGDGLTGLWGALRAGIGMNWVFILPLLEDQTEKRMMKTLPVVLVCTGVVLALCLMFPHEQLRLHHALADCMVQTVQLPHIFRLGAICLWLVGLFLSVGSVCSLAAEYSLKPFGRQHVWLPGVFVSILVLMQLFPVGRLWHFAVMDEMWLAAALGVGMMLCIRRAKG